MALLEYPSTLRAPTAAPLARTERRLLDEIPGPRDGRVTQRDRLSGQDLEFIFTYAELEIWSAWLETIFEAGAWFSARWAQPEGGVGIRRFIGVPSYPVYVANVGFRVQGRVEIRGASVAEVSDGGGGSPPDPPETILFLDNFNEEGAQTVGGHQADIQVGRAGSWPEGVNTWTGGAVITPGELEVFSDGQTADILFEAALVVPAGKALHIKFKIRGDIGEPFTKFEWDVGLNTQTYYIYSTNGVTVYLDDDAGSLGPFIFNPGLPAAEIELVICPDWFTVKVDGAVYADQQAYSAANPLAAGDTIIGLSAFYQGGATAYYTDYFKMTISDPPDPL
jgi:hypothetical protein